jgi:hypothetical protein
MDYTPIDPRLLTIFPAIHRVVLMTTDLNLAHAIAIAMAHRLLPRLL